MSELIKINLGTLKGVGAGLPVQGQAGAPTVTATVAGAGAVSATVVVRGSNDGLAWTSLATLSPSGTDTAVASGKWSGDYAYLRADAGALSAGAVVTTLVAVDQTGASSGDVVGGGGAVLVGAEKVRSMLAAIRTGGHTRVNLAFHGHSLVAGMGVNGDILFSLSAAQQWRLKSMPAMLGRALNGAVGGEWSPGFETMADPQRAIFTLGGAAFVSVYGGGGPNGNVISINAATDTAAFAAQGTAVRVLTYASGAGVVARYQINGGAVQNVAAAPNNPTGFVSSGNTLVWYDFTISGLTIGDTVTLLGPASGSATNNYRVFAVDPAYVTTPGVSVHRMAFSNMLGAQVVAAYLDNTDTLPATSWLTLPSASALRDMQTDSLTKRLGASGVLNMFDVNEHLGYDYSGQAWGWTLATKRRHMQNYLNAMDAREMPVVLCFGPFGNPAGASRVSVPYTQLDIIDTYKELAELSNNTAWIDLTESSVGSTPAEKYADQQASGLVLAGDNLHWNAAGAAYFGAQKIAKALLSA